MMKARDFVLNKFGIVKGSSYIPPKITMVQCINWINEYNESQWISIKEERLPEFKDLPFITKGAGGEFELWEDTDWFDELTEKEQLEWESFMILT